MIKTIETMFACAAYSLLLMIGIAAAADPSSDTSRASAFRQEMLTSLAQGDFRKAIQTGTDAAQLFRECGMLSEATETLVSLSSAYQALGHYRTAHAVLATARELAGKTGDVLLTASVLAKLGGLRLLTNILDEAEILLTDAYALGLKVDDPEIVASVLNDMGNLHFLRGMHEQAILQYRESLWFSERAKNTLLGAKALVNMARAEFEKGDEGVAETLTGYAVEKISPLTDSHDKAYGFINIGQVYRRLSFGRSEHRAQYAGLALRSFNEALNIAEGLHDRLAASYALGYVGQAYEEAGNNTLALIFTRRALFEAQAEQAPESLYLWQWQNGRLCRAEGRMKDALLAYRSAVNTLQSIRQEFLGDCRLYNQLSFQEVIEPVYLGLVGLLLDQSDQLRDQQEREAALIEAIQTIELLKTAELQDYFHNTCVVPNRTKISRRDVSLAGTAIAYFILMPDRLELIVGLPDGIKNYTLQVDRDTLTHEVRNFRRKLEKRTTREYLVHARKLYDWLVRPYEAELSSQKVETIVFVPEGPLRTIPLAALHDGNDYLVARFPVATTPGLGLTEPQPLRLKNSNVLLTGLSEAVQGFPALPYVTDELKTVEKLFPFKLLLNTDFRVSMMKQEFDRSPYSIIHIASHGEFLEHAEGTYLLTWDERLTMDELEKFIRAGRFRKTPVDLLTLSACKSAAGNDRAALGLAGVSVKAGARSSLATLWYVNDQSSAELVAEFYRQLTHPSRPRAKALQEAQLKLAHDIRYQHPGYWAPFLLIGSWL